MPVERRIREGAERNADVLDPDVDRFLESVVRTTRRRQVVRRSLGVAASVAVLVAAIVMGPSVLDGVRNSDGSVPGSERTTSEEGAPTPSAPLLAGTFSRTIRDGTAIVRVNEIAGIWTINAGADGAVRLLAPQTFPGAHTSRPFQMRSETLVTDAFSSDICEGLPAGTYSWSHPDGFLLLTAVSDRCDVRVMILGARPWAIDQ